MVWWNWVNQSAKEAHKEFLETPLDRREHIFPRLRVPMEHSTVECWMRPRILACLPTSQRDWIELRAQAGTLDESNVLLFYALKVFSPGSPDEQGRAPQARPQPFSMNSCGGRSGRTHEVEG